MIETLRDKQIEYIKGLMDVPKTGDVYSKTFILAYDYLKEEIFEVAKDITERIRDGYTDDFIESWSERVYDHIISKINWKLLNECDACHKFYDDSDAENSKRFCSNICEDDYEEVPDRGER